MNIYKKGTWLAENVEQFQQLQDKLMELQSKQDSIPGFDTVEMLNFIRGAVNEVKRATNESESLVEIIKGLEVKAEKEEVKETNDS